MYRVDDVVSGRITPTFPLPAAVVDVSFDIAANDRSNELTLNAGGELDADGCDDGDVPPPPHPATSNTDSPTAACPILLLTLMSLPSSPIRPYTGLYSGWSEATGRDPRDQGPARSSRWTRTDAAAGSRVNRTSLSEFVLG
ncbi:hypothetical protein GCM10010522_25360 [Kribbella solani]